MNKITHDMNEIKLVKEICRIHTSIVSRALLARQIASDMNELIQE